MWLSASEATCSEALPAVAAGLCSGELFHGTRTSIILGSVSSVSLSLHVFSSWAFHRGFSLCSSVSLPNVAMVMSSCLCTGPTCTFAQGIAEWMEGRVQGMRGGGGG